MVNTPVPGLSPQNLADRIADQLRNELVHGKYAPGMHLSEAGLCEQLNVSRNTLREAFRVLIKEGLLQHIPHRGVSVIVPTLETIIDIYRVRKLIECRAVSLAYPLHPAVKRMRSAVSQAEAYQQKKHWAAVGTANMDFHRAIAELTDSPRVIALFDHLLAELRLAFGLLDDAEFLHSPYLPMNGQITTLLEQQQPDTAAELLSDYLHHSERVIIAAYSRRMRTDSRGNGFSHK
ncbi:GntR family transcriptional regulator [Tatumella sp. JGM100]|nr:MULTISPECIES: GntR family transcriptional regulator [unclassified Tatumella]MBS0856032.1 GntR family transcriptional regulator [Tatumella sp. JGM16]MBS0878091.1 GntR family transcriptional regulator [Tatumella sp. JGM82]MBS0890450.1 GntR family transcriptional regulator [Tatumella sp. JGM94]MBS0894661.1 GntR family transcriptional regulator [Tatumella sp. JGM130]MBS0900906.1 GntR family transcriptional regulator [Tatumella sp. JGM100]